MKKLRMLSLSLAMSMMLSQTAQAAVFITPFGEKVEVADSGSEQQTQIGGKLDEVTEPGSPSEPGSANAECRSSSG